jgi:hypothetical protein
VSGFATAADVDELLADLAAAHTDLFGDSRFSGSSSDELRLVDVAAPESDANLIAFASGWGDGSYPVWIGRTASGDVACLVADMLL